MPNQPTHEEILAKCRAILERYLGDMQDAMDELFDVLESANYVVQDEDDDYAKADQLFGFLIKDIVNHWDDCDTDPFA